MKIFSKLVPIALIIMTGVLLFDKAVNYVFDKTVGRYITFDNDDIC